MKRKISKIVVRVSSHKFISLLIVNLTYFSLAFSIYIISKLTFIKCKINPYDAMKLLAQLSPKPEGGIGEINHENVSVDIDLDIIIPAYNSSEYIQKCIDSVILQKTKYKYNIIIINDGSIDDTEEKLKKYNKFNNIKIFTQENKGFSGARNAGINQAKGNYLLFLDSDDYLNEDAIENLLDAAYNNQADIVQGSYNTFVEDSIISNFLFDFKLTTSSEEIMNLPGYPWGKVIKRTLFSKVRFPENYWYEDTIMHMLVFRMACVVMKIPNIVYSYRINPKGITSTSSKFGKCIDTYWVFEELEERAKDLNLELNFGTYKFYLFHLGHMNSRRTRKLDREIQMAIFTLSCECFKNIKNKPSGKLDFFYKGLERALEERNFYNWKIYGRFVFL